MYYNYAIRYKKRMPVMCNVKGSTMGKIGVTSEKNFTVNNCHSGFSTQKLTTNSTFRSKVTTGEVHAKRRDCIKFVCGS